MRFAYADPPYLGCGRKRYADEHPEAADYDDPTTHRALIDRLAAEFPDGWALSTSSPSLRTILPMCPEDVRVLSWCKPFAVFKPNVGLAYAWEPVILRGGRKITRDQRTVRDWLAENIALKKGLTGAKPERFCMWVFSALNAKVGDTLEDVFPGTGIVGRSWRRWTEANAVLTEIGGARKNNENNNLPQNLTGVSG